ncbi:MAG: hypothetical protein IT204_15840 [Fimbriimonadaceae bacterium]|nr:hypothetical protein [Fimbriimonadaceae bacterium]
MLAATTTQLEVRDEHVQAARDYPYQVAREDDLWVARVIGAELPYLIGAGASSQAAVAALQAHLATELAARDREGAAWPRMGLDEGREVLRIPATLHAALQHRATAEGRAAQETLVDLLTEALSRPQAPAKD